MFQLPFYLLRLRAAEHWPCTNHLPNSQHHFDCFSDAEINYLSRELKVDITIHTTCMLNTRSLGCELIPLPMILNCTWLTCWLQVTWKGTFVKSCRKCMPTQDWVISEHFWQGCCYHLLLNSAGVNEEIHHFSKASFRKLWAFLFHFPAANKGSSWMTSELSEQ